AFLTGVPSSGNLSSLGILTAAVDKTSAGCACTFAPRGLPSHKAGIQKSFESGFRVEPAGVELARLSVIIGSAVNVATRAGSRNTGGFSFKPVGLVAGSSLAPTFKSISRRLVGADGRVTVRVVSLPPYSIEMVKVPAARLRKM